MYSYLLDKPLKAYGIKQFFYFPIGMNINLILAMLAYVAFGSYVDYVLGMSTHYTLQLELYTSKDRNGC